MERGREGGMQEGRREGGREGGEVEREGGEGNTAKYRQQSPFHNTLCTILPVPPGLLLLHGKRSHCSHIT